MSALRSTVSSTVVETMAKNETTATSDYSSAEYLILIFTPIITVFGTVGNIICVIIMMRRHFRSISTGVYLFSLALADTVFLYMNSMVMNFTRLTFHFDFRTVSIASCKIYIYMLMLSKCWSAWIIVAVTVERLLAISFPLKAQVLATRKRAWIVVGCSGLVLSAIYLLPVFTYTHIDKGSWVSCDMSDYHKSLHRDIALKFMDLIFHCILPSVTLFICNILLTMKIMQSKNVRRAIVATPRREGNRASRVTTMLLLVSGVFLLLNLPMSLYLFAAAIDPNIPIRFRHWDLVYRILYILQISNSAINFPLYCLSGPLFRNEVNTLCRSWPCGRRQNRLRFREATSTGSMTRSLRFSSTSRRHCHSRDGSGLPCRDQELSAILDSKCSDPEKGFSVSEPKTNGSSYDN